MTLNDVLSIYHESQAVPLASLSAFRKDPKLSYPTSWLYCFDKEDAIINEKGCLVARTSIEKAIWRTKILLLQAAHLDNCVSNSMENLKKEVEELYWFLSSYKDLKVYVSIIPGKSTESINLFKKSVGFGAIHLKQIPKEGANNLVLKNEILDFLTLMGYKVDLKKLNIEDPRLFRTIKVFPELLDDLSIYPPDNVIKAFFTTNHSFSIYKSELLAAMICCNMDVADVMNLKLEIGSEEEKLNELIDTLISSEPVVLLSHPK